MKFKNVKIIAETDFIDIEIADEEVERIKTEFKRTDKEVLELWVEEQFSESKLKVRDIIFEEEN